MRVLLLAAALFPAALPAQTLCPPTPAYSPCDVVFEMSEDELRAHPNPYVSVRLEVEFRSPRYRTYLLPAFWDGANRIVVRFAPTEAGAWDFRVSSNLERFNGTTGRVQAAASNSPGFIRPRNTHHWVFTESDQPHLWMGDTCLRLAFVRQEFFDRMVETRARQKFNHLRGLVIGAAEESAKAFPSPDRPDPQHFRQLDQRILALNKAGIAADLVLASGGNHLAKLFPTWQQRERYVRYVVARYSAMHVTWQGVQEFEDYENGRELLKEVGALLKKLDPYDHPRSTGAASTSAPLAADGWMSYVTHHSAGVQLGAVEHQLYAAPFVNTGLGIEEQKGAPADALRKQLWNAAMNGEYPTSAEGAMDPLDSPAARQMTVWFDFFSGTRHWELEPYFDVDGGRAVALEIPHDEELEGIEYIVYVEKPGPVELVLQRQKYDVAWLNPVTGERLKQKEFRGNRLKIEPPDNQHDWVLHVSRESKKEGMLRSYKFETHTIPLQEVEQNAQRTPYEIVEPSTDTLSTGKPVRYAAKINRDTRATRNMMWLWTGEVSADGQGYRVLGAGLEGEMRIPAGIAKLYPAVMSLRLAGMNANGKVYFFDKVYRLTQ
jgi:hypothetical protein